MDHDNTLVLNCGSSSLKFAVLKAASGHSVIQGLAERLNSPQASLTFTIGDQKQTLSIPDHNHQQAIAAVIEVLKQQQLLTTLCGVGHRVVHGGEAFSESLLITSENLEQLTQLNQLAPLHNPVNILGIQAINALLPNLPQVAVFDTAFHHSLPEAAYLYGLPYELYQQHGVRRYGFHGTSYRYVAAEAARRLDKKQDDCHFLIAHLGNGCSACAVRNGKSVDTSMGFTPLEGLTMGTRSGDIDPGLMPFLSERLNLSIQDIMDVLNKQSGLLGLSGISNDMREIQQAAQTGDIRANLAIEVFAFKIARYLGALAVSLPKIDALIFTGGIGENDRLTRAMVLEHLAVLGFTIDGALNQENGDTQGRITTQNSPLALVIPTNEEWMIAQDTQLLTAK